MFRPGNAGVNWIIRALRGCIGEGEERLCREGEGGKDTYGRALS